MERLPHAGNHSEHKCKQFHAVSLSGVRTVPPCCFLMIERDMPINMVLSADTGMEFLKCTNTLPNWTSIFPGARHPYHHAAASQGL